MKYMFKVTQKTNRSNHGYLLTILTFLSACIYDPGDARLKVTNIGKSVITLEYSMDTIPDYPSVNHTEFYLRDTIKVGGQQNMEEDNANWPRAIAYSKNKKLNLFVFNIDSLKHYKSIDTLIKRRIYKYFKFSEEELEKLDWKIQVSN